MNPNPSKTPTQANGAARDAPDAVAATAATTANQGALNERLCHLFRASIRNGRIHPLYLPILKYRHSRSAP